MKKTYAGSCHCGAVRFEADIDLAPLKHFDMLHDDAKSTPAETRHL